VDKANRPDLTPLVKASEIVGRNMPVNAIVIYESTVYPGATEEVCVPVLEKFSGLKYISDDSPDRHCEERSDAAIQGFYCGYSPERPLRGHRAGP